MAPSHTNITTQEDTDMKIYYITKSKGRAGCANITYRIGEYASKADLKREYKWKGSTILKAYYEDEMTDEIRANFNRWM